MVLTWEADSDKKFRSETEGDRLRFGPVQLSNDGRKGSVFNSYSHERLSNARGHWKSFFVWYLST